MSKNSETTTVQVEREMRGKTVVSFSKPTPMWATWIFRVEFLLNKAILMVLSASHLWTPEQVKESLIWIAAIDFFVWGIARGLGVDKNQFEEAS